MAARFSISIFFFFVLLKCSFLVSFGKSVAPAMYVFGDSLVDPGNNNLLLTWAKANYPPYGKDFPSAYPTGRFTNGKTFADILAEHLSLPLPAAYLALKITNSEIPKTGINYASGSCGILNITGNVQSHCTPFWEQIDLFRSTIAGNNELTEHLAKSIFLISIGGNDFINNYLIESYYNTSSLYTLAQFTDLLIKRMSGGLTKLHELGARKFLVMGASGVGCTLPTVRNNGGECNATQNEIVSQFNKQLVPLLNNLEDELEGSHFAFGDGYAITKELFDNPTKYGFKSSKESCCQVGPIGLCDPLKAACFNYEDYLYWDDFHPTEKGHYIVANSCFDASPSICTPTLKQLANL